MSRIDYLKEHSVKKSYRVDAVRGMFDFTDDKVVHEMHLDVPLSEKEWKIGCIVGASGAGKSTTARELFGKLFDEKALSWKKDGSSFIDSFGDKIGLEAIVSSLTAVGLSSPPDWMKPFNFLSNGQQFRATLARRLLEAKDTLVFDEFTSVVDRQVAKSCSNALNKYLTTNQTSPRFVAVSCHRDIVEFLRPDWVLDIDARQFTWRGRTPRPTFEFSISPCERELWNLFRKNHYLSSNLSASSRCYIVTHEGMPVAFASYLVQPHAKVANLLREHRVVVLPDYQGLGLGNKLSEWLAKKMIEQGFRYTSVTSHPSMVRHRIASPLWKVIREAGRVSRASEGSVSFSGSYLGASARLTYSFEYVGQAGAVATIPFSRLKGRSLTRKAQFIKKNRL